MRARRASTRRATLPAIARAIAGLGLRELTRRDPTARLNPPVASSTNAHRNEKIMTTQMIRLVAMKTVTGCVVTRGKDIA